MKQKLAKGKTLSFFVSFFCFLFLNNLFCVYFLITLNYPVF